MEVQAKENHYVFKRLRRPMTPPSQRRQNAMTGGLCLTMFLLGWVEGCTGPILPFLQDYYKVSLALGTELMADQLPSQQVGGSEAVLIPVSIIYLTSFAGGVTSGLTNVYITDRLGFGLAAPLGAMAQCLAYVLCATGGPYGLFAASWVFIGFGFGLQDAQVNNLTTRLPNAARKMFVVQAFFGLGGTVSPLVSTSFARAHPERAYLFFIISAFTAAGTAGIMLWIFQARTEEQVVGKPQPEQVQLQDIKGDETPGEDRKTEGQWGEGEALPDAVQPSATTVPLTTDPAKLQTSWQKMAKIGKLPSSYAMMGWSFFYVSHDAKFILTYGQVGMEVSVGAWMTTFLVTQRAGTSAAGYASTGFWGAVTVGRIVLIPLTEKIGHQRSIYLYSSLTIVFFIVIWFTNTLVGNAICFAVIGLLSGPVYPVALMEIADVFDDDIRGGIMGLMGSTGGAGAAVCPFVIGAISDRYGMWILQPVNIAMTVAQIVLWAAIPRKKKSKSS